MQISALWILKKFSGSGSWKSFQHFSNLKRADRYLVHTPKEKLTPAFFFTIFHLNLPEACNAAAKETGTQCIGNMVGRCVGDVAAQYGAMTCTRFLPLYLSRFRNSDPFVSDSNRWSLYSWYPPPFLSLYLYIKERPSEAARNYTD